GSEHYLTKPFTKDELLSAIETHIGRRFNAADIDRR
ncbi:MAG: hypothetical protein JWO52_1384, partial [Gammaproteobacteria bacterium]|nr:hypothetical protein [Gammaproteobacteria bacterium]